MSLLHTTYPIPSSFPPAPKRTQAQRLRLCATNELPPFVWSVIDAANLSSLYIHTHECGRLTIHTFMYMDIHEIVVLCCCIVDATRCVRARVPLHHFPGPRPPDSTMNTIIHHEILPINSRKITIEIYSG